MKKIILIVATAFSFSTKASSQVSDSAQRPEKIFTKVDVEAQFTGGDAAWSAFLRRNLQSAIPKDNGAPAGSYTVIVKFVVARNGTVGTAVAETNHGFGMEQEAIRVIKKTPKWIAAIKGDNPVSSYRRQPITFVVP